MSKIKSAFDAVRALALSAQTTYSSIAVGALPAENSICMALSAGAEDLAYIHGGSHIRLSCVINAKHSSQSTVMEALCLIHEALTTGEVFLGDTGWQIVSIRTTGVPSYLGFDGDQYLYGSSIEIGLECE